MLRIGVSKFSPYSGVGVMKDIKIHKFLIFLALFVFSQGLICCDVFAEEEQDALKVIGRLMECSDKDPEERKQCFQDFILEADSFSWQYSSIFKDEKVDRSTLVPLFHYYRLANVLTSNFSNLNAKKEANEDDDFDDDDKSQEYSLQWNNFIKWYKNLTEGEQDSLSNAVHGVVNSTMLVFSQIRKSNELRYDICKVDDMVEEANKALKEKIDVMMLIEPKTDTDCKEKRDLLIEEIPEEFYNASIVLQGKYLRIKSKFQNEEMQKAYDKGQALVWQKYLQITYVRYLEWYSSLNDQQRAYLGSLYKNYSTVARNSLKELNEILFPGA